MPSVSQHDHRPPSVDHLEVILRVQVATFDNTGATTSKTGNETRGSKAIKIGAGRETSPSEKYEKHSSLCIHVPNDVF